MRTAKLLVWLLVLGIASGSVTFAGDVAENVAVAEDVAGDVAESTEREDLSILYAGYPGGPRAKAWTDFLRQWFSKVESIDLRKLNGRSAADFDVVVADWTSRYKDGSYNTSAPRHNNSLGKDFTKPIIMISAVGAELTRTMQLKTDWL